MFIKPLSHTHSHFPPFSLNPSTKSCIFFLRWDGNYHAVKWEDGKQKHSARLWLPASQAPYTVKHTAARHCRPESGCMYLRLPELRKISLGLSSFGKHDLACGQSDKDVLGGCQMKQPQDYGVAPHEMMTFIWCTKLRGIRRTRYQMTPKVLLHLSSSKLKLSACSSGVSLPTWHATRAAHWCRQQAISAGFMTAMIQVGESITQPPGMRRTPGCSLAHDSVIIQVRTISLLSHMVCVSDLALWSPRVGNI